MTQGQWRPNQALRTPAQTPSPLPDTFGKISFLLTAPPNMLELSSLPSLWPGTELGQASLLPERAFFLGSPRPVPTPSSVH